MIPILYENTERDFASGGLGWLADASACRVRLQTPIGKMGEYELELTLPPGARHGSKIRLGRIVAAVPFCGSGIEPFEVYDVAQDARGGVSVKARHVSYRLQKRPVGPLTASTTAEILAALNSASPWGNCGFAFAGENLPAATAAEIKTPTSVWELFDSDETGLLTAWGAWCRREKWTVTAEIPGARTPAAVIAYGKNLLAMDHTANDEAVYTHYKGFYFYESEDRETGVITTVYREGSLLEISQAAEPRRKIMTIDVTRKIDEGRLPEDRGTAPATAEIDAAAAELLAENGPDVTSAKISTTVDFVDLSGTLDASALRLPENVQPQDLVEVRHPSLPGPVRAPVVETVWDVLLERYEQITVGELPTTLADLIL